MYTPKIIKEKIEITSSEKIKSYTNNYQNFFSSKMSPENGVNKKELKPEGNILIKNEIIVEIPVELGGFERKSVDILLGKDLRRYVENYNTEKELEKIDAYSRIKILSLPDLDYLNNDEAIKRLREWCYGYGGSVEILGDGTLTINKNKGKNCGITMQPEGTKAVLKVSGKAVVDVYAGTDKMPFYVNSISEEYKNKRSSYTF